MQKKYGDKVIKDLERLDRQLKQFTIKELEKLKVKYSTWLKENA